MRAKDYHQRTGCVLHTCYWPAKLLWLQATHPDVFHRAMRWMSFGEYLALRLFGKTTCSLSMASGTGLFDQNTANWDREIMSVLPIRPDQLNPLTDGEPQSGLTPEFARLLAPLRDLPWLPALGDGACSNIGSSAVSPERIAINVGTSAAMRILVAAENVQIRRGLFCYRVDSKRFLLGGAFADGGNVCAWQRGTLQLGGWEASARRLGEMPPDGHGLTVLPFWAGERSTGWHLNARAAILGLNLHTTPLDILRASLEAVSYRFLTVRDLLLQNFPDVREIVASGGALIHVPAWMQIMAYVFGSPVIASRVAEASSRGAALHALESLGLIRDLSDAPLSQGRAYKPDRERHRVYRKAHARHSSFYTKIIAGGGE